MSIPDPKKTTKRAPKTMRKDPFSMEFFKLILAQCSENETITPQDYFALGLISERYSLYKQTLEQLHDENGVPIIAIDQIGDKGQDSQKMNQLFKASNDLYTQLMNGLREFGLTPKSRNDVQKIKAERESLLHHMMKGVSDDD